jgi:hypothetical protein
MDFISLEVLFVATAIFILIAIELGYRAGNTHPDSLKKVREKITSTSSSAILGMLAFILVFAFGIVYGRYDSKKALVREEANIIRNAWLRSDFLPEPDRSEALKQFRKYVDLRIDAAQSKDLEKVQIATNESKQIQHQLWDMAVVNARKDMNSDVAALYIESLNEMINQHATRLTIGLIARIPGFIWFILYLLVFLGMFSIGYQASISNSSRRSWLTPVMVLTFSLMILLIASLDRPQGGFITISQQPLIDLRNWMDEGPNSP